MNPNRVLVAQKIENNWVWKEWKFSSVYFQTFLILLNQQPSQRKDINYLARKRQIFLLHNFYRLNVIVTFTK